MIGFTPKWGIGCRRLTPGDPYMVAIQKENVDVHFTAVEKITEDGVVGGDGIERKVDTVVCATGEELSVLFLKVAGRHYCTWTSSSNEPSPLNICNAYRTILRLRCVVSPTLSHRRPKR